MKSLSCLVHLIVVIALLSPACDDGTPDGDVDSDADGDADGDADDGGPMPDICDRLGLPERPFVEADYSDCASPTRGGRLAPRRSRTCSPAGASTRTTTWGESRSP